MGGCASTRKQLEDCSKSASFHCSNYKQEASKRYECFKNDIREKYEIKAVNSKLAVIEKKVKNMHGIHLDRGGKYKTEFHSLCIKFEKQFPF